MNKPKNDYQMSESLLAILNYSPVYTETDPKLSSEQKKQILDLIYKKSVIDSGLKEYIDTHNVNINYEIHKDLPNTLDLGDIFSKAFDIGNYSDLSTKHGRQTFLYNESTNTWNKGWKERGILYRDNRIKQLKTLFKNNKISVDAYSSQINQLKLYEKYSNINDTLILHISTRWKEPRFQSYLFYYFKREAMIEYGIENNITFTEEKIRNTTFDYKSHPLWNYWRYIILKNKVVGYSQKPNSNVLWVDIDNDFDNSKFNEFMKLFNSPRLLWAEKSNYSGGWHLALLYNKSINDSIRPLLEKYTEKNNLKIECCFTNNFLQTFGSIDYSPLNISEYYKSRKIEFFNQNNYSNFMTALEQMVDRYISDNYVNDANSIINISSGITPLNYNLTTNIDYTVYDNEKAKKWDVIKSTKAKFVKLKHNSNAQFIEAKAGNKFPALLRNTLICMSKGITNNDEIRQYLKQYAGTSTTIDKISDSSLNTIKSYYYKNKSNYYSTYNKTPLQFISNSNIIPDNLMNDIKQAEYNFAEQFYNNAKIHYKDKQGKRKQDLKIIAKLLLIEVIGKWIYDISSNTQIILPNAIKDSLNDKITNISLPIKYIELFLKNLKNNNKINFNYKSRHIREIFEKTFDLIPSFIYNNMNKEKYENIESSSFFMANLPIQYNIGKFNSKEELISLLLNKITKFNKKYTIKQINQINLYLTRNTSLLPLLYIIYVYSNIYQKCYNLDVSMDDFIYSNSDPG